MRLWKMIRAVEERILPEKRPPAEPCAGCGAVSHEHPMVGVTRVNGQWTALPVCAACWRYPGHRKHKIKAHFFPRHMRDKAVANAGSARIGARR